MKVTLDYRNPTPSHCDVAVFINGALAGVLKLRQQELDVFQHIIVHGMDPRRDEFLGTGDPGPFDPGLTSSVRSCRRCGGQMRLGRALISTIRGQPDFADGEVVTQSPGGPGRLVDCLKCSACGHSVFIGTQP